MLLLLTAVGKSLCGQTLIDGDTVYHCVSSTSGQREFSHKYQNDAFDGWVVLENYYDTVEYTIFLNCVYDGAISPLEGVLNVWDGYASNGRRAIIDNTEGQLYTTVLSTRGRLTMHLDYNAYDAEASFINRTLNVSWVARGARTSTPCSSNVNVAVGSITSTSAVLHLVDPAHHDSVRVNVGGQESIACGTMTLSGLTPNTKYTVEVSDISTNCRCNRRIETFYTTPQPHVGPPDVLDLQSEYVRCTYGSLGDFNRNTMKIGIINNGPGMSSTRHIVRRDTTETDVVSGRLLHTVGPGMPGSIKLGNILTGAQAESIEYYLHVDTTRYSLILLHYAVVLQNPNHAIACQPRFKMEILDGNDSVIDPQCGAADFRASSSLGWNVAADDVLWKDWTTIGINLAPYHGQNVKLRFSTIDCCEGGHFGYAYFYADCQQPFATAELCGTVDTNTFTAPDGFNYLWYSNNDIGNVLSTSQSVTYPTSEGSIQCRLSFIENPDCYLTMNTYVSNYWPRAEIDTFATVSHGCNGLEVQFNNRSTVLGDDSLPLPHHPPCDSAWWDFGDGESSGLYYPTHIYANPGTYTVTLIATLQGGCSDTTQYVIEYILPGATEVVLPTDTFCYNSTYQWYSQQAGDPYTPITEAASYTLRRLAGTAVNGCDSIEILPLVQLPPDSTLDIYQQANCDASRYLLTAVTDLAVTRWSSNPYDSALYGLEGERQVWVQPTSDTASYSLTSYRIFRGDSLFCPTTKKTPLHPIAEAHAAIMVIPEYLSYDNLTLKAFDVSDYHPSRQWSVIPHPDGDTLRLADTLPTLIYTASAALDSITVLLTVIDGPCSDNASATLPVLHSAQWIPNVFTPSQPSNNRFAIVDGDMLEGTLTIYNRHGLKVFSTDDPTSGWDGTHNGEPCQQGAYPWHLRYRTIATPERWHEKTGTVTLIR